MDNDNNSRNHIRVGEGRRPTLISKTGHLSKFKARPPKQLPRNNEGRVYVMQNEETEDAPNVVTCTFSLLTQLVDVLFDSSATYSFISVKLVETLGLIPTRRTPLLSMTLPDGKTVI